MRLICNHSANIHKPLFPKGCKASLDQTRHATGSILLHKHQAGTHLVRHFDTFLNNSIKRTIKGWIDFCYSFSPLKSFKHIRFYYKHLIGEK